MEGKILIAVLERCSVRQSDIARELGVSRATVSRWRSGEQQMSKAHYMRALEWAQKASMAAVTAAEAHDAALPARTLLDARRLLPSLKADLQELWHDQQWEMLPARFNAVLFAILQRWGAYVQDRTPEHLDPKPQDVDQLWEDTKRIRGWINTWRRLHQPPAGKDPEHGT